MVNIKYLDCFRKPEKIATGGLKCFVNEDFVSKFGQIIEVRMGFVLECLSQHFLYADLLSNNKIFSLKVKQKDDIYVTIINFTGKNIEFRRGDEFCIMYVTPSMYIS